MKSDLQFNFFLKQKNPCGFAEVSIYMFLNKNYNSISAEGSGILQDILHTVNFIFSVVLMRQICKLFFNQPNKN
ncbi:hypothetical protein B0A67_16955 [Flavobacterium aquidurense]|nr:hypothetical protein B0A67_16955 [Flavobacterium aquidurense]